MLHGSASETAASEFRLLPYPNTTCVKRFSSQFKNNYFA